jgi:hypothetical protein
MYGGMRPAGPGRGQHTIAKLKLKFIFKVEREQSTTEDMEEHRGNLMYSKMHDGRKAIGSAK